MKRIDKAGNIALLSVVVLIVYLSPNFSNYLALIDLARQASAEHEAQAEKVNKRVEVMLRTVDDIGLKDNALLACVKNEAKLRASVDPRSSGGQYTVSELTRLHCSGLGIRNLDGLERMPALKNLSLFSNEIKDVRPIEQLKQLEHIDLSDNRVTDISPLATLPRLQHLNLTGNNVIDIMPLGKMSQLISLSMPNMDGIFCADIKQLQRYPHIRRTTSFNRINCQGRIPRDLAKILEKSPSTWTREEEEAYLYYKIDKKKGELYQNE